MKDEEGLDEVLPVNPLNKYKVLIVEDDNDVWFDSGSTHAAVLEERPELRFPADLYMEGGDQFRGWFQSSLLTSVASKGCAPYKSVLCHGWVVDEQGKQMHKSAGNGVEPSEIIKDYGADIIRLWVASSDYTVDDNVVVALVQNDHICPTFSPMPISESY